ncbi:splicing factor [Tanacetum coccineum]
MSKDKPKPKKSKGVFTVNLYHDGIFAPSPIKYLQGELKQITDIDFKGLGIKELKSDSDVEDFLKLGYDNGFMVDLYVEHYGYDVINLLKYENVVPQFSDSSDDEYSSVDREELENVDFYTTGEEDVIIKNLSTHDDFLNRLCSTGGLFRGGVPKPCSSLPNIPEDDPDGSTIEAQFKVKRGTVYPVFNPDIPWNLMEPVLGMWYNDPEQLKLALCNYGVAHGYQLNYNLGSLVNYKWIACQCADQIIKDPFIPLRTMKEDIRQTLMIDVSLGQCKRAKQTALYDHEGGLIDHYGKLWDYRQALLDSNPVRVQNEENWSWFISLLYDDLNLNNGNVLTIISNSHKGLLSAVADWLPQAKHRKCTRHLYANFKKRLLDESAYDYLIKRNPNSWSRAFFEMDKRCYAFKNGISESFNRVILLPMHKPIITMLEEIRIYIMQRLVAMNKLALSLEDTITPSIRKQLEKLKEKQRMWELSGYAMAGYMHLNKDPDNGVSYWFSQDMWFNAYQFSIRPVPGTNLWKRTKNQPLLPPIVRRMPGSPQKERIKSPTEESTQVSRVGRRMTCGICWEQGHNKAGCKNESRP